MYTFIKRILLKSALFSFLLVCFVFATGQLVTGSRLNSFAQKEKRVESINNTKKIMILGGSSADYGVDSELIENVTGLPVVNFSMQGSLGLSFMLNQGNKFAHEGDIVLLHLEPALFYIIPTSGESTLIQLISRQPGALRYVSELPYAKMPLYLGETIRSNILGSLLSTGYMIARRKTNTELRNIQGDYIGHKGKESTYRQQRKVIYGDVQPSAVQLIESFIKEVTQKKVKVYYIFPPIDENTMDIKCLEVLRSHLELIEGLHFVNTAERSLCKADLFFDTSHHLRYDNRVWWTNSWVSKISI